MDTYSIERDISVEQAVNYRWSERYDRLSASLHILQIREGKRKETVMKHRAGKKGFSLVELMIVVAIVAILVALALPSYSRYVRKANRGEAQQLLMNWANNQEIWRANDTDFATEAELPVPTADKYTFTLTTRTATAYTLTATASTADQLKDKEGSTSCSPLTLDQSNTKTPAACW
jgi:type IV pilus assembly protein PilE